MDIAAPPRNSSLHRRIRSIIEDRIRSGEWRPNHRIVFEHVPALEQACPDQRVQRLVHGHAMQPYSGTNWMDRQTWRAGAAITAVRLWFAGDLQKLVARFTLSGADNPAKPR